MSKMISSLISLSALALALSQAPAKQSESCDSFTTEAYHSPKCNQYVVHDPKRADDIKIPHSPPYHTYSRWALGDQTVVLAYRDVDKDPTDMVADAYLANGGKYEFLGSAKIPGMVTDVSSAELTGGDLPDIVFHFDGGQLKYVDVLRFSKGKAQNVFQYAASKIEVSTEPKPKIVATSKLSNVVEEFAWDSRSQEFRTTSTRPWHKAD
jgi:hypothetical protein